MLQILHTFCFKIFVILQMFQFVNYLDFACVCNSIGLWSIGGLDGNHCVYDCLV